MPVGKVLWFDQDKGFGFVTNPGDDDVYVSRDVLPDGVHELVRGQKVEYDFVAGRRGPQALRVSLVDTPKIARKALHKHEPEQLASMIGDVILIMENNIQPDLRAGRWPDNKHGKKIAEILRAVADELEI
ncbi:cold-shock protein [Corynebacterium choanae]|uniref:Cold shock protein CspD n=1 Tax=Corynebacterium choanae TaxID=1862358 RepID=A0A3G6J571_9CORY|nr:cold shock domain-containing protein [Corynebacterium choanae]AZA13022.1 Cold shock protein CspD [Corynebacterium choanae]